MEVLKTLVIILLVVAYVCGTEAETESNRQGRCGGSKRDKPPRKHVPVKKPGGHKFHHNRGKGGHTPNSPNSEGASASVASASASAISDSNAALPVPDDQKFANVNGGGKGNNNFRPLNANGPNANSFTRFDAAETDDDDQLENIDAAETANANVFDIDIRHGDFGSSPRIRISEDGDVSYGRSINFKRHFHEEGQMEHEHPDLNDEEHDIYHKTRTAKAVKSNPEELSGKLTGLQQGLSSGNSAASGDNSQILASGNNVQYTNYGNSQAAGSGATFASGTTNVSTSGGTGWSSPK